MDRNDIFDYVRSAYHTEPDYLFKSSPEAAVLRHKAGQNGKAERKWFAAVLRVSGSRLGLETEEDVDVLNVKADPELISVLQTQEGFLPAYHMNKEHWISILLGGTVEKRKICSLIDGSYELTKGGQKSR